MATGQTRDVRIITKKTAIPGRIPTGTTGNELNFIRQGELAQNTFDKKLFGFDGTDVFEFGVNTFLNLTGGTISGNLGISGNLSANTFYSGSVNLYDIFLTSGDLSGTSVSAGSNIDVQQTGSDYKVSVVASPSFNNITFSGTGYGIALSANSITASTLNSIDYIDFDTGATTTAAVGRLRWNDAEEIGGLEVGMRGGNVNLQIGEENLARVYNDDIVTLTDGMVVYVVGSQGNTISVRRASATGETTSARVFGVVTEPIPVGERGFVNTYGLVRDIDTSAYTGGTPIYLGTTLGSFTNIKPEAPNHICLVGFISRSHPTTGSLFVHISNGWELDELHDVIATGLTNLDILQYDFSQQVWQNTNSPVFNSISAVTFSAGTINSGSTNLYSIFQPINKSPYNTYVLTAGTSYSFSGIINTLSVNKTVGSATQVNLPSNPNTNDFFIVKDRKGDSKTNPITVSGVTKTIDGSTSYVIKLKDKPSLTFLFDGEEYIVI